MKRLSHTTDAVVGAAGASQPANAPGALPLPVGRAPASLRFDAGRERDPYAEHFARVAEAPEVGLVRGMFFTDLQQLALPRRSQMQRRYLPFSMYPLREFMQLLLVTAREQHPERDAGQALCELGRRGYPVFAASMAGISLLGGASLSCEAMIRRVPQAYAMLAAPGRASILACSEREAVVALRDVWTFPESYNVGAWLGGFDALGVQGTIDVIRHSWCNVDLHVRWSLRK